MISDQYVPNGSSIIVFYTRSISAPPLKLRPGHVPPLPLLLAMPLHRADKLKFENIMGLSQEPLTKRLACLYLLGCIFQAEFNYANESLRFVILSKSLTIIDLVIVADTHMEMVKDELVLLFFPL